MNVHFGYVVLLMMVACVVFSLKCALKAKKVEEKQVRVLYLIIASCAFVFIILSILVQVFSPPRSLERLVFVIQEIILGVAFGIFLAMRILGHFKPSERLRKTSDEDSQNDG